MTWNGDRSGFVTDKILRVGGLEKPDRWICQRAIEEVETCLMFLLPGGEGQDEMFSVLERAFS
jgi:hypothetical protein